MSRDGRRSIWIAGFVSLGLLYMAVRLWTLTAYPLDGDEIFSFRTARAEWQWFRYEVVRDAIHPPLFYLLLRGWVWIGGQSLLWVRLFPLLGSVACLVPLYLLARELRLPRGAAALAMLLLSLNPAAVFYAQHVRMYSLLMLLSLVALWLLVRELNRPLPQFGLWPLCVTNLLLVYTHYFGWVVVALEAGAVLLWRRNLMKRFAARTALVVALFTPWAYLAVRSLAGKGGLTENLGWVPLPAWVDLGWYYVELLGLTGVPHAVHIGVIVCACLVLALVAGLSRHGWLLAGFAFLPPLAAFAASHVLTESVWGQRHLIVSAAPFYLLCGLALWKLPHRRSLVLLAVALSGWMVSALAVDLRRADAKLAWDSLVVQMIEREDRGLGQVPFFALDPYVHYAVKFHLDMWRDGRPEMMRVRPAALTTKEAARRARVFDPRPDATLEQVSGRAWVGFSRSFPDPVPDHRQFLTERGCQPGDEISIRFRFGQVTVFPVTCAL